MSFLTTTPRAIRAFRLGESYWKVEFRSGRILSELDTKTVLDGQILRVRDVEWLEDLIGSGDLKNIKRVELHTPKGSVQLDITEPYTAFQMSRGTLSMLEGVRIKNMQLIGKVTDKAVGQATAYVWDVQDQELYQIEFDIREGLPAWRVGVIPVGKMNLTAMDVRLD